MPKAIIKHEVCVWSFFYCVLLLFELETLSVWAKIIFFSFFFFKMLMKIKHSVVEMLWAWTKFDIWFLNRICILHLPDVLSNLPLTNSHSRMIYFFLIMSKYESPSSWANSCQKLIWTDFRNKGSVDCAYRAWSLLLCSLQFVMNFPAVLLLQNWKEEAKKTWEFYSRGAICLGLRSFRKIKWCLDTSTFFNGAC